MSHASIIAVNSTAITAAGGLLAANNLSDLADASTARANLGIADVYIAKGAIAAASDFPTSAAVQTGWTYRITADVTDNDATKTNTGQSFLSGADITWNGTNWTDLGPASFAAANVTCTPSGSITATDVDTAISQTATQLSAKLALTGGSLTGALSITTTPVGDTPLSIAAPSGQTADIVDVTLNSASVLKVTKDGYTEVNRLNIAGAKTYIDNTGNDMLIAGGTLTVTSGEVLGVTKLGWKFGGNNLAIGDFACPNNATPTPTLLTAMSAYASATGGNEDGADVTLRMADHGAGGAQGAVVIEDADENAVLTIADTGIGFFGGSPVAQRAKANYNDWAAFGDVVDALVDLNLFDTA